MHLPELHRSILEFIKSQPPTVEGVHVSRIATSVAETDANKIRCELRPKKTPYHLPTNVQRCLG